MSARSSRWKRRRTSTSSITFIPSLKIRGREPLLVWVTMTKIGSRLTLSSYRNHLICLGRTWIRKKLINRVNLHNRPQVHLSKVKYHLSKNEWVMTLTLNNRYHRIKPTSSSRHSKIHQKNWSIRRVWSCPVRIGILSLSSRNLRHRPQRERPRRHRKGPHKEEAPTRRTRQRATLVRRFLIMTRPRIRSG